MPTAALGIPQYLTKGGTAKIYRLPGYSIPGEGPLIYKEYLPAIRKQAGPALLPGLISLAEFRVKLSPENRAKLDQRAIWPLAVVTGDDGAAGIVIREIPGAFFHGPAPLEFQQLFNADADAKKAKYPVVDLTCRLVLLARFAESLKLLHDLGVIFGDVSAKNVAFTLAPKPRIMLVDTDSARQKGTRGAFGSQPHTFTWEPPEAVDARRRLDYLKRSGTGTARELSKLSDSWKLQTTETDVFKFGLMVVRVLDYGRRRTQNRDPEQARRALQARLGRLAAQLLDRTLGADPGARPTMDEWYQMFRGREAPPGQRGAGGHPPVPAPPRPPAPTRPAGQTAAGGDASGGTGWQFVEGVGWVRR